MVTKPRTVRPAKRKAWVYEREAPPSLNDLMTAGEPRRRFFRYWVSDNIENAADLAVHFALKPLPFDLVSALGARVGRFAVPRWHKVAARRARANLEELAPDLSSSQRQALLRRCWANQGRALLEFSIVNRLGQRPDRVQLHGTEHAERALEKGGVIFLSTHLGNWELCAPVLSRIGVNPHTVYDPPRQRARAWLASRGRQRGGLRLVPPGKDAVRPLLRGLKAGEPILIHGDEGFKGRLRGPLFGRKPHLEGNLAVAVRLARLSGAPVCPLIMTRRGETARFDARFLPPLTFDGRDSSQASLLEAIQSLNDVIEPHVRANLDQWYFLDHRLPPL